MHYNVGQIIYVVLSKKGQVYPMRIVEEIIKKSLNGETINYVVQAGADATSTIMLDQIEGEIFEAPEEAKNVLISRATSQIEKIIQNAVLKSKEWYSNENNEYEVHELPKKENNDKQMVTLPDGTVARLKLPMGV